MMGNSCLPRGVCGGGPTAPVDGGRREKGREWVTHHYNHYSYLVLGRDGKPSSKHLKPVLVKLFYNSYTDNLRLKINE